MAMLNNQRVYPIITPFFTIVNPLLILYHPIIYMYIYTLRLFNIAMEHGPFIDGLPLKDGGSFHGYAK